MVWEALKDPFFSCTEILITLVYKFSSPWHLGKMNDGYNLDNDKVIKKNGDNRVANEMMEKRVKRENTAEGRKKKEKKTTTLLHSENPL
jgi:hypothetical protein